MKKTALLGLALLALAACGDDDDNKSKNNATPDGQDMAQDMSPEPDQAGPADMGQTPDPSDGEDMAEDLPTFGDIDEPGPDEGDGCDEAALVTKEWPLVNKKSEGAVTITEADGVFTAVIDAAAGGTPNQRTNAFVYLDLDNGGAKVDITDIESLTDTSWELAFKRVAIRSNSGNSGAGQTKMAKEIGTTFEAVTAAPALDAEGWETDVTVDEQCELLTDPIGTPNAAVNYLNLFNESGSRSWYDYGGEGGLGPVAGDIYFVKSADSNSVYKLEIQSWASGVFTVRWSLLP